MNRQELVTRLMSIESSIFLDNPYVRAREIAQESIVEALNELDEEIEDDSLRLLFLLDYSREVQSLAQNFGESLSEDQAADRVEEFWSENFE